MATKIDDTNFVIKHLTDPTKNVEIEMFDDGEGNIEWDGLPMSLITTIEKDYETCKAYPLMCINMAI